MPRYALPMLALLNSAAGASAAAPPSARPQTFERHAVVSESALASEIGAKVLEDGGNAVDAAVATAFALAVVHPAAGNLGGGGFLLVAFPDGRATSFDFREAAPLAATEDMFLDAGGNYSPERHHEGILSVGVPGTVAGLRLAHERLGRLPWRRLLQPAVELAAKGFRVPPRLSRSIEEEIERLRRYPETLARFAPGGRPLEPGQLFVQEDLARSLERIRDGGAAGFYEGETARLLLEEVGRRGGIVRAEDLRRYRAVERAPLKRTYRGYEVVSMPPPSSGGAAILEMLGILSGYDLAALGPSGWKSAHLMIESMRRAFADRARYLGDPDQVEIPLAELLSDARAAALRHTIRPDRASRSTPASFEWPEAGEETTHLSVVDGDLMAASLTTTLEASFGCGILVEGAGFLLNNEMGDFNPKRGLTTADGLIGTPPNLVAPGKRMLSSMAPTIVLRGGKPRLVLGTPGGRTIINTVLEVLVNAVDHGMPIQEAVDRPRFHHQWLPDEVLVEPGCFSPETLAALEKAGHAVRTRPSPQGSVMAIAVVEAGGGARRLEAGVDRRRGGAAAAGR